MKTENGNKNTSIKNVLLMGGMFLGIFAISAAGAFTFAPQRINREEVALDDSPIELTGSQKLMANIVDSVSTGGLGATVNEGLVVINGKKEGYSNKLQFAGTKLKFKMDTPNIHGIDLSVDAKVDYNGAKRGLGLSLVDDMIYFNVTDYDSDAWDLKYKVSTKAYATDGTDSEVGGVTQYSYGTLDWLIEDIVAILTGEGMDISFPSVSNIIKGDSNSQETAGGSSLDAQAILNSMNNMEELTPIAEKLPEAKYFGWDLALGDAIINLGLRADSNYNLVGVDFPRLKLENDALKQEAAADLVDNLSFKVQLAIETNNLDFGIPSDSSNYKSLENSVGLFEKIAQAAGSMRFGVDLDIDLGYGKDGEEATIWKYGSEGINDAAKLTLNADIDANGMKLNAFGADLEFAHMAPSGNGEDLVSVGSQKLSASYLPNEEEGKDMYINLNDTLRAKSNKVMLDEVIGSIKDALNNDVKSIEQPLNAAEEENTEEQIKTAESAIMTAISKVKDSEFVKGIQNGVYDSALKFIKSIVAVDNEIRIVLSLEPLGIDTDALNGEDVVITLGDKNDVANKPLLTIDLNQIKFASFTADGTIAVNGFENIAAPANKEDYVEMSHLKGVTDQIIEIVDSKAATLTLEGGFEVDGSTAKDLGNVGVAIGGKIAFDASDKNDFKAGIKFNVLEREEKFIQNHNIKADVAKDGDDSRVFFTYDSINPEGTENCTNPNAAEPINGTIGTGYAKGVIENIVSWSTGTLDNRFSAISRAFSKPGEASLMSDIASGNYFALAEMRVIKSFRQENGKDILVINAEKLGLDQDIEIAIRFNEQNQIAAIDIASDFEKDGELTKKLNLSVGLTGGASDLDTKVLEDHDSSHYCNYDSVMDLADYAVNTTTLGAVNQDGHGQTTLGFDAKVSLVLGDYNLNLVGGNEHAIALQGALSIDGAQLQASADLKNVPTIKGVNAPESARYFRDHEYEGSRDASFYFYSDGLEVNDQVMMTRNSSYGKLRDVKDSVRMSKDTFADDVGGWLLKYFLGVDESLLEENAVDTQEESTIKSYGLPLAKAIHVMDVFHGIEYTAPTIEDSSCSWTIDLSLGQLGFGFLGNAVITIGGDTVTSGSAHSFKTLTGLKIEANIALGGQLQIAKVALDLSLTNVADHTYRNIWNEAEQEGYFTYFCPTVVIGGESQYGVPSPYGYVSADGTIDRNYIIESKGLAGNYYVY